MEGATALTNLTSIITEVWNWTTEAFQFIVSEPLLLIGVGIFAAGAGIGLVRRVIGR